MTTRALRKNFTHTSRMLPYRHSRCVTPSCFLVDWIILISLRASKQRSSMQSKFIVNLVLVGPVVIFLPPMHASRLFFYRFQRAAMSQSHNNFEWLNFLWFWKRIGRPPVTSYPYCGHQWIIVGCHSWICVSRLRVIIVRCWVYNDGTVYRVSWMWKTWNDATFQTNTDSKRFGHYEDRTRDLIQLCEISQCKAYTIPLGQVPHNHFWKWYWVISMCICSILLLYIPLKNSRI